MNAAEFLEVVALRPGDLLRSAFPDPGAFGDLARRVEAKGEAGPEKASKPLRLAAVGVESPRAGVVTLLKGEVNAAGDGDGDLENIDVLEPPPKMFWPFTEAKGELVEA